MNYIKNLQAQNKALKEQIGAMESQINNFVAFLHSAKFVGFENGARKDWISTGDVINWMREFRGELVHFHD